MNWNYNALLTLQGRIFPSLPPLTGFLQLCTMLLCQRPPSHAPNQWPEPGHGPGAGGGGLESLAWECRFLSPVWGCSPVLTGLPSSATGTPTSSYFWTSLPSSGFFRLFGRWQLSI